MTMQPAALRPRDVLRRMPFLVDLPETLLTRLADRARRRDVARGEVLMREGDPAETLYFILNGRFLVLSGATPIAELAAGEPVGEIAFFAGGTRSATVRAMRFSQVLELTRADYEELSRDMPELNEAIIRALAARVVAGNPRHATLEPRPGATICLRPVTGGRLPPALAARLLQTSALGRAVVVLTAADVPGPDRLQTRVHEAEAQGARVLLVVEDADGRWAEAAEGIADTVLLVADAAEAPRPPDAAEAALISATLPPHLHLALLRESADRPIAGTADWLADRPVGLHHHVALDSRDDIARLARFLTGTATGVVFCGGAAFGTAHLGMLKALRERGYAFDMVGGSSIGAAMAGGYAMGLSPDDVMDLIDTLFLKSGAMRRYTAPLWSLVDHTFLDAELRRLTRDLAIEDLPLPYFAVATSLTRNDLGLVRTGPLWRAIRASGAIPAVFPPVILDDGEVLIDGGLIDNAPLGPMRDLKPGPNVVMNITRPSGWRSEAPYSRLPGRGGALRQMLMPAARRLRFPRIVAVLTRAMIVNAERSRARIDARDDVMLTMHPLPGMDFLDWSRGRALFEHSYRLMAEALAATENGGTGAFDDLHRAARALAERESG